MIERESSQKYQTLCVRASLRQHNPNILYDWFRTHICKRIRMKIEKGYALIALQSEQNLKKLKIKYNYFAYIEQTPIKFYPVQQNQQLPDIQKQEIILPQKTIPQPNYQFKVEEGKNISQDAIMIQKFKINLLNEANQYTERMLKACVQKQKQIRLQFQDEEVRKKQLLVLKLAVQKKMKIIQDRISFDLQKHINFVKTYYNKQNSFINVQSKAYKIQPNFLIPKLKGLPAFLNKAIRFSENQHDNCIFNKLTAINGNQFAVTLNQFQSTKAVKGFINIYNVNSTYPYQTINMNQPVFGVCMAKNFLLAGGADGRIKYIDLSDPNHSSSSMEISQQLFDSKWYYPQSILQLKQNRFQNKNQFIFGLGSNYQIRLFQLQFEQITSQSIALMFKQKLKIEISEQCKTFDIFSVNQIIYPNTSYLFIYDLQKKNSSRIFNLPQAVMPTCVKRLNSQQIVCCIDNKVSIMDKRKKQIGLKFNLQNKLLKLSCIQTLQDRTIICGEINGRISVIDYRKPDHILLKSSNKHRHQVHQIMKLQNQIISCGSKTIFGWNLKQMPNMQLFDEAQYEKMKKHCLLEFKVENKQAIPSLVKFHSQSANFGSLNTENLFQSRNMIKSYSSINMEIEENLNQINTQVTNPQTGKSLPILDITKVQRNLAQTNNKMIGEEQHKQQTNSPVIQGQKESIEKNKQPFSVEIYFGRI